MNSLMLIVSMGALWDGYTSFYGIAEFYGLFAESFHILKFIFAIILALIVLGFMIATKTIWSMGDNKDPVTVILKGAWIICFVLDFYTSFIGIKFYVFNDMIESGSRTVGLIVVSFLITVTSILFSEMISSGGVKKKYLY